MHSSSPNSSVSSSMKNSTVLTCRINWSPFLSVPGMSYVGFYYYTYHTVTEIYSLSLKPNFPARSLSYIWASSVWYSSQGIAGTTQRYLYKLNVFSENIGNSSSVFCTSLPFLLPRPLELWGLPVENWVTWPMADFPKSRNNSELYHPSRIFS